MMNFRRPLVGILLATLPIMMQSCYYDNEAHLYPKATAGDTAVSYSKRIAPMMSSHNCLSCHTGVFPSGGLKLETYDEVKAIALDKSKGPDGRLYGAVAHLPGYIAMPQGGNKLPDADIQAIKKWVDAGAPNN
jgi:hypothetical protein